MGRGSAYPRHLLLIELGDKLELGYVIGERRELRGELWLAATSS
jgi:hypothetical protein